MHLHVKSKSINHLGENLCELGLHKDFLDLTARSIKDQTDKLNLIKVKTSALQRESRKKSHRLEKKKSYVIYLIGDSYAEYIKEFSKLNENTDNPIKIRQKNLTKMSPKKL